MERWDLSFGLYPFQMRKKCSHVSDVISDLLMDALLVKHGHIPYHVDVFSRRMSQTSMLAHSTLRRSLRYWDYAESSRYSRGVAPKRSRETRQLRQGNEEVTKMWLVYELRKPWAIRVTRSSQDKVGVHACVRAVQSAWAHLHGFVPAHL